MIRRTRAPLSPRRLLLPVGLVLLTLVGCDDGSASEEGEPASEPSATGEGGPGAEPSGTPEGEPSAAPDAEPSGTPDVGPGEPEPGEPEPGEPEPAGGCGDNAECSDGNPCNGAEVCAADGSCVDGVPALCSDDNPCNGIETCDPGVGCVGGALQDCDDGDPCNGVESCDPTLGCVVGEPLPGCCIAVGQCSDLNPCNGIETCDVVAQLCVAELPPECDDGNPCNGFEACLAAGELPGCQVVSAPIECDDGNACNGLESCDDFVGCSAGSPMVCDDEDPCTLDTCAKETGCTSTPLDCDDDEVCTVDACEGGDCIGSPLVCDDDEPCNGLETCTFGVGCEAGPVPEGPCSADFSIDFALSTGADGEACAGSGSCAVETVPAAVPAELAVRVADGPVPVPGAKVFFEVVSDEGAGLELSAPHAFTLDSGVATITASSPLGAEGHGVVKTWILGHEPILFAVEAIAVTASVTPTASGEYAEACARIYLSSGGDGTNPAPSCASLAISFAADAMDEAGSACASWGESIQVVAAPDAVQAQASAAEPSWTLLVTAQDESGTIRAGGCLEGEGLAAGLLPEVALTPSVHLELESACEFCSAEGGCEACSIEEICLWSSAPLGAWKDACSPPIAWLVAAGDEPAVACAPVDDGELPAADVLDLGSVLSGSLFVTGRSGAELTTTYACASSPEPSEADLDLALGPVAVVDLAGPPDGYWICAGLMYGPELNLCSTASAEGIIGLWAEPGSTCFKTADTMQAGVFPTAPLEMGEEVWMGWELHDGKDYPIQAGCVQTSAVGPTSVLVPGFGN